jgi:thiosulfate/3-mercaptopyruvate sulfurtransferase
MEADHPGSRGWGARGRVSLRPLISAEAVAASRNSLHVCDIRWDLSDPGKGRSTYESGHIPGAVFVDLDRDLSSPPGSNGRHPLPSVADFARTLGRLGIDPATHVVVYDDVGGRVAARLWWMLRSIGHGQVQVLDGGYQAWIDAGYDVGIGTFTPEPKRYPAPDAFRGVVGHEQLEGRVVLDARAEERYRGDTEPVDPKAGHIPGAINFPASHNLDEAGRFRRPEELGEVYRGLGKPVVSCGSGVTACHDALAMVSAGMGMPDVYVGSFSEWSRLDLPVNVGLEP